MGEVDPGTGQAAAGARQAGETTERADHRPVLDVLGREQEARPERDDPGGREHLGARDPPGGRRLLRGGHLTPTSAERTALGVGDLAEQDQDQVDDRPDAEAAAGKQLGHAQAGVAQVEAVDAEGAGQPRQQDRGQPLLIGEQTGDVLGEHVVLRLRGAHGRVGLDLPGDGHLGELSELDRTLLLAEVVDVERAGRGAVAAGNARRAVARRGTAVRRGRGGWLRHAGQPRVIQPGPNPIAVTIGENRITGGGGPVHVAHLTLHDFRSYADIDVALEPGVTAFVGSNGQGKTNLVEAVDYLSRLSSHRVATDAPLIRAGADQAIVRAAVVRDGRTAVLEVELNPGRANRARINRSPLSRARDLAGIVRTVVFSPEDLALVKGDPGQRRRFLDDLLVLRTPRYAGVLADYERVLKQRNTLLKTLYAARGSSREAALATLAVWDDHLVATGSELLGARRALTTDLAPYVGKAYEAVARGASRDDARIEYQATVPEPTPEAFRAELERRQGDEIGRGLTLVGPHRDDVLLTLGPGDDQRLPVRGYASHGESWSFALALRLASYDLLRADGDDPILVLDDVFAELDADRRVQLAALVAGAEQVLVTAAVAADVPEQLSGATFHVAAGEVTRG
ncbi:DNA recombination and repair protein RecF [Pimelobacter simplex]|uniref:DNA replication and repair protein RecF n=1 Tax=Nocardioides simplex TaxID=2045 RepID=A0A0A1DJQ8_NOCSI|nr:DNA recombination and repair protein RecF [Pimelobacter simplex]